MFTYLQLRMLALYETGLLHLDVYVPVYLLQCVHQPLVCILR